MPTVDFGITYTGAVDAPTEIGWFAFVNYPTPALVGITSLTIRNTTNDQGWRFQACNQLVSIVWPNLTTVTGGAIFTITNNTSLATISFPVFLPPNGKALNFSTNALSAVSVNHILARAVANAAYVSGTITLSGGTNAAPTGQGIADKATLQGRGVTVNTN